MAITSPRSVLILGAGVSACFGLPLGDRLVDLVAEEIGKEATRAMKASGSVSSIDAQAVVNWAGNTREWFSNPIYGTVLRAEMGDGQTLSYEQANSAHKDLQRLRELLCNQTAETIDSFIAENPKIARTAKLAVAALILKRTYSYDAETGGLRVRPFAARTTHEFVPGDEVDRNWIHLLINIVRHGIDSGDLSSGRKIQIVTFNYDTILEHVLEKQFTNREAPLNEYKSYIDIHHMHGQFGPVTERLSDPPAAAVQWAGGIYAVNEHGTSQPLAETRQRVFTLLREAGDVYAIGFAFAGPNCRLLGLDSPPASHDRALTYCNYDGNRGTKESVERYFKGTHIFEKPGDPVRKLTTTAFIKGGYLGEPPS